MYWLSLRSTNYSSFSSKRFLKNRLWILVTLVTVIPKTPCYFICSALNLLLTRSTHEVYHLSYGLPSSNLMFPPVSSSVISLPIFCYALWYIWFLISLKLLSNSLRSYCLSCIRPIITPRFCSMSLLKVSSSMSSRGLLVRLLRPKVHI